MNLQVVKMADAVLHDLTSTNLFDLSGVVAVVTGGGTVSSRQPPSVIPLDTHEETRRASAS